MADKPENHDIFDETTKIFVDLASESSQDGSMAAGEDEKDENENVNKTVDDKNPENPVIDLTLEEEAPPLTKVPFKIIQVKDSGLNPTIDLDRSEKIPIVSLDRSEIPRFLNKGNYDRAVVESEELQRALDRATQLRNQKRVAKAELKARKKKQ